MDAQDIATRAKRSIEKFCMEECKAYCCRKGYLIITESEKNIIMQDHEAEFKEKQLLIPLDDGRYSLFMGTPDLPCPSLKDFKCLIHKNEGKPSTCGEFPVFIHEGIVSLSGRCLAVKDEKFYPFIKEWEKMGLKVKENSPFEYD